MINPAIFKIIEETHRANRDKISKWDILAAINGELGEFCQAVRVEDRDPLYKGKSIRESSRTEMLDVMLCCVEMYIARGGTLEELEAAAPVKLAKWLAAWSKENSGEHDAVDPSPYPDYGRS